MNSKVIVAAAGSGKTTYLIDSALNYTNNTIILTYTTNNESSIKKRLIQKCGHVPKNIVVQTWLSFILEHGVRPFSNLFVNERISGIQYAPNQNRYIKKTDVRQYYFDKEMNLYSDRASQFVVELDNLSDGAVINRISSIFNNVLIDEAQDLSGYDYDFVVKLFEKSNVVVVGDPRQRTYVTNLNSKNKSYNTIFDYIQKNCPLIDVDTETLSINHRCSPSIVSYSDLLFPEYCSNVVKCHSFDDISYIKSDDVEMYLSTHQDVMQLRHNRNTKCSSHSRVMNYGDSKGLEFESVLIYVTKDIQKWLFDHSTPLSNQTRCKLYVAITRAKYSVCFVVESKYVGKLNDIHYRNNFS